MQSVLIVVHLIIVLALVGVVLLQRSEGGGLGMGGGGSAGFMTGRGQANVLTRTTAVLAGLFFLTSLALTILASQQSGPRSIFDGATIPGATIPGAAGPGASSPAGAPNGDAGFERLQQLQESETPAAPAPAGPAPAVPAPTGPQVPNSQ